MLIWGTIQVGHPIDSVSSLSIGGLGWMGSGSIRYLRSSRTFSNSSRCTQLHRNGCHCYLVSIPYSIYSLVKLIFSGILFVFVRHHEEEKVEDIQKEDSEITVEMEEVIDYHWLVFYLSHQLIQINSKKTEEKSTPTLQSVKSVAIKKIPSVLFSYCSFEANKNYTDVLWCSFLPEIELLQISDNGVLSGSSSWSNDVSGRYCQAEHGR